MSGEYHPYLPTFLKNASMDLSAQTVAACEEAAKKLVELDARARYVTVAESLARVLLRSEAISSSRIEGLEMNVRRLLDVEALDELGVHHRLDSTEAEVMGNVAAMQKAVADVSASTRVTVDDILAIHAALRAGTRIEPYGGALRTTQNWVGGSWYNPIAAAYVPPPALYVPALMEDLVAFVNMRNVSAIVVAAVAHAQLETIHPFIDGNGRTGRALVHVALKRGGFCQRTVAPISLVLATMKQRYIDALSAFRVDDEGDENEEMSARDGLAYWIEFFCSTIVLACDQAIAFEDRVESIRATWQDRVKPRGGSAAELLMDALPGNPVVSIASAARMTGRSYPAARGAVRHLEEKGVLVQSSKNKKSGLYVAQDVLDAFVLYERALASPTGDTRIERPVRPVPQRPSRP